MSAVILSKRILFFSIACFFVSYYALSQNNNLTKDQSSLATAEQNFAATAVSKNIKTAFMKVLDEKAVVFRPHPINGRWSYLTDTRPDSTYLFWQPEFVDVSAGGDFGYSTGPWFARRSKYNEEGRKGFGNYVTIWAKDKTGTWYVLLDKGVNYSNLGERKTTLEGAVVNTNIRQKKIDIADILALDSKAFGGNEMSHYTASSLLFQHRKWPFRLSSDSLIKEYKDYETWEPLNGAVAPYGDMAFTYGKFNGFINGKKQDGYYLRIWKRNETDEWIIALDLRTEN